MRYPAHGSPFFALIPCKPLRAILTRSISDPSKGMGPLLVAMLRGSGGLTAPSVVTPRVGWSEVIQLARPTVTQGDAMFASPLFIFVNHKQAYRTSHFTTRASRFGHGLGEGVAGGLIVGAVATLVWVWP